MLYYIEGRIRAFSSKIVSALLLTEFGTRYWVGLTKGVAENRFRVGTNRLIMRKYTFFFSGNGIYIVKGDDKKIPVTLNGIIEIVTQTAPKIETLVSDIERNEYNFLLKGHLPVFTSETMKGVIDKILVTNVQLVDNSEIDSEYDSIIPVRMGVLFPPDFY